MADQLTLFEPGWADFAPHITASPHAPDSKSYLHLCYTTHPSSCQYPLINYRNLDDDIDDHQTILARSLEELQHKLNRMEQELIIVGEESKELQLRLGQREDDLTKKVRFKRGHTLITLAFVCLFLTK